MTMLIKRKKEFHNANKKEKGVPYYQFKKDSWATSLTEK